MAEGTLCQEGLLSSFHELVLQDLTKGPLSPNLRRDRSVQSVRVLVKTNFLVRSSFLSNF